jgi:ribosome maturation factor RimP
LVHISLSLFTFRLEALQTLTDHSKLEINICIIQTLIVISQRRIIAGLGDALSPILLKLKMISKGVIQRMVEEKLSDTTFIVDITVGLGNAISVIIDSDDGLSIDKCIEMSRHIEHQFDREVEDFSLEVSSPGLTQPFKVLRQYLKNLEREVEIVTAKGDKVVGILKSADEMNFIVETTNNIKVDGKKTVELKTVEFSMSEIKTVKPVITFK